MQISTTARHCELDPEIRLFAHHRLERLQRFARDLQEARLVVSAEKYRHAAEITLKLKHHEMISREVADDPKMAVERAADRLEQQLRKLKERRIEHKRAARGTDGNVAAVEAAGAADEEEEPGDRDED